MSSTLTNGVSEGGLPAFQGGLPSFPVNNTGIPHNYLPDWNSSLGSISVYWVNDMFSNSVFTQQ